MMPDPDGSGTARTALGRQLRHARVAAGLSQSQASRELRWGTSKLRRIENGDVGLSYTDLGALFGVFKVHDPETRARWEELAQKCRQDPWSAFHSVASVATRRYLSSEGAASYLHAYEPALIPALLRTEAYAWTVITAFAVPGTETDTLIRRLDMWQARRAVLDRDDPLHMSFVVDEAAIHRLVGRAATCDDPIVTGQITRLFEVAHSPHVTLQILPIAAGLHVGLSGPFTLLTLTDGDRLLHRPGRTRPVETDPHQVKLYDTIFTDLAGRASPPDGWFTTLEQIASPDGHLAPTNPLGLPHAEAREETA